VDWNLVACAARHHLTYAPADPQLRAHLHVDTAAGPAWRCLRCGTFVLGAPLGEGPAEDAPVPLRGQLLRDAIVLRSLAFERLFKGLAVLFAAYGIIRFRSHADAVRRAFNEDLPLIQPLADSLHWNLEDSSLVHTIRTVLETRSGMLAWIAAGLAFYGVLQLIEATGLWLLKRWGEYMAAIATSLFIPIEIYEIAERVTWIRVFALVINIAAVVFIVYRKRLFGARGGRAAYDAERHHENLVEVLRKSA
jgi:uncharacterized membrane protein (DUF2068 family)